MSLDRRISVALNFTSLIIFLFLTLAPQSLVAEAVLIDAEEEIFSQYFDESDKLQNIKSFSPNSSPQNSIELIDEVLKKDSGVISKEYLLKMSEYFYNESKYLGNDDEVLAMSFSMFKQWVYLELFKLNRLEYLMTNYLKSLALDSNLSKEEALFRFKSLIKIDYFDYFPNLLKKREKFIKMLTEYYDEFSKKQDNYNFLIGSIESVYLSKVFIENKKKYLSKRFSKTDEKYLLETKKLDENKLMIESSMSILQTQSFKKNVNPFYKEVTKAANLQEQAVNKFFTNFNQFIANQQNFENMIDYLSGREINDFGKSLAKSLSLKSQKSFRERIKKNLGFGLKEIKKNLEETLNLYDKQYFQWDIAKEILLSNTMSSVDNEKFNLQLKSVFEEQILNWLITQKYSFLKSAAEDLTNIVDNQLTSEYISRTKRYSSLALLMFMSPLGKSSNVYSSWLGKYPVRLFRVLFFSAQAYLTATTYKDSYLTYQHWKNLKRLTRLSASSMGLTTVLQEELAFKTMLINFSISGFTLGLNALTIKNHFLISKPGLSNSYFIRDAAAKTWEGNAISLKKYVGQMKKDLQRFSYQFKQMNLKQSTQYLANASRHAASIMTQMMVMPVAVLPQGVKGILKEIPKSIYQGASLGTVMGVMGVTVQHYINAASLKFFVNAFRGLGFTPPVNWQMNSLDTAFKSKRNAFLMAHSELHYTTRDLTHMLFMLTDLENKIRVGNLNAVELRNAQNAIVGIKVVINNVLRLTLAKWYQRPEYRQIYNSVLQDMGFGLVVTPSMENPLRMTIVYKLGSEEFIFQTTSRQLDELKNRDVIPDLNVTMKDLEQIEKMLQIDNKTIFTGE